MPTLHAVDFPQSGSPTAAGRGQDPASVCHYKVRKRKSCSMIYRERIINVKYKFELSLDHIIIFIIAYP